MFDVVAEPVLELPPDELKGPPSFVWTKAMQRVILKRSRSARGPPGGGFEVEVSAAPRKFMVLRAQRREIADAIKVLPDSFFIF